MNLSREWSEAAKRRGGLLMPIRPENRALYPKDWKKIRKRILERAGDRCERCGLKNYALGFRNREGRFTAIQGCCDEPIKGERPVRIILTIAHVDHNPENNAEENLQALCQQCHNRLDGPSRAKSRRARLRKGQQQLF